MIKLDKKILTEVTDKDLMVFLVAAGFEIEHVKRDIVHSRSLVYFEKTEEFEKAMLRFANKDNMINYSDYAAADRRVTTILNMYKTTAV